MVIACCYVPRINTNYALAAGPGVDPDRGGLIIIFGMRRPRRIRLQIRKQGAKKSGRQANNQTDDTASHSYPSIALRSRRRNCNHRCSRALYGLCGRPDLPDQPLHKRTAELAQKQAETKAEREARRPFDAAQKAAAKQPDDIASWLQPTCSSQNWKQQSGD